MKEEQKKKNPYSKTYGLVRNLIYLFKKTKKYNPIALVIMFFGCIAGALSGLFASFINKLVIDLLEVQTKSGTSEIMPLIKLLSFIAIAELVIVCTATVCNSRYGSQIRCVRLHIISEHITKVLSMDYEILETPDVLDFSKKAQEAVQNRWEGMEGMLHNSYAFMQRFLTMAITFTGVLVLDVRLILVIAVLSTIQFFRYRYISKKDKREVWDTLSPFWRKIEYMEQTTQDFEYAKDIRLFGMKKWLLKKQKGVFDETSKRHKHSCDLWMASEVVANIISMLTIGAIYAVLIYAVLGSDMSIGNFTLFLGLATSFSSSLAEVLINVGTLGQCSMKVDDFRSFMDLELGEKKEDKIPLPKAKEYTFEFKNVCFKYRGADTYALKNLNLTLKAGTRLAVVGLNGAGKTTFIKLLLRLYDVTEGEILLNGVNIKNYSKEDYYTLFSPVFQNVEMFAFPMSQNVSMDTSSSTDIQKATDCIYKADLGEKLEALPNGINTEILKVLSDEGIDLSGGQKQKLALARALYKDAPVVVLDEPTAALDPIAEYKLYKSFDKIIGKKSAVYISHRLSSTRFCDAIAMFKDGVMVEYGRHEELLSKNGPYSQMFEIQAQYYKDENASETEQEAINV